MTPALVISGFSGAGKTTLIEQLLPRLAARGLAVAVLKHDAHQLDLEPARKDTARFFAAGARFVAGHDDGQLFVRQQVAQPLSVGAALARLPSDVDLVLVEGHKRSDLPRLALAHPDKGLPEMGGEVLARLPAGEARLPEAEQAILRWLDQRWRQRPLGAAIFVGGGSTRMGFDKAKLVLGERSLLEVLVDRLQPLVERLVLVGAAEVAPSLSDLARLPDAPDTAGPAAGLLALLRHDPGRAWLCVACDMPHFGHEQAQALTTARQPGRWYTAARLPGRDRTEPFGAIYEPALREPLGQACRSGERALHRMLATVPGTVLEPDATLARGWDNANTSDEWRALTGQPAEAIPD